jgi:hypothetical protein
MQADVLLGGGKQLGNFQLREPNAAVHHPQLHAGQAAIFGLVSASPRSF